MIGWKRYLNAAKNLDSILLERRWRLGPDHPPAQPPTWPLDPDRLRDLVIDWPTKYSWPEAGKWVAAPLMGLSKLAKVVRSDIDQPDEGVVSTRFAYRGRESLVAIDYSDYLDRVSRPLLDRSTLYFKMQYRSDGYADSRVVPGGYVNPIAGKSDIYKYIKNLRSLSGSAPPLFDTYGRFGLRFAAEIRRKAVELLSDQRSFGYEGGVGLSRYSRSLREAARSRICIDLPSNSDFTFRLLDNLAIGACIVGPRPRTTFHVPFEDRTHIVHCADDLSDLVSLCQHYLQDDPARERIRSNARDYFDRYLHRDQLAGYYLDCFFKAVN